MSEMIMVTDAKWLNGQFGEDSVSVIPVKEDVFFKEIEGNYGFMERDSAETDVSRKQIISYCLIAHGDEVFITQRTAKQTEKRLHNRYSVGIGGHISFVDTESDNAVIAGMQRELFEEVDIPCPYTYEFIGLINDNSTEVNSVHAGACFLIKPEEKLCSVKETDKMHGFWIEKNQIGQYKEGLEGWSRILIRSLFGEV